MAIINAIETDDIYVLNTLSFKSITEMINYQYLENDCIVKIDNNIYFIDNTILDGYYGIPLNNGKYANYLISGNVNISALNCFNGNTTNGSIINNVITNYDNFTLCFDLESLNIEQSINIPCDKNINIDFMYCHIYGTNDINNGLINIGNTGTYNTSQVSLKNGKMAVKGGILDVEHFRYGLYLNSKRQNLIVKDMHIINVDQTINSACYGIFINRDSSTSGSTDSEFENILITGNDSFRGMAYHNYGIFCNAYDNVFRNIRINGVSRGVQLDGGVQQLENIHVLASHYANPYHEITTDMLNSQVGFNCISGELFFNQCYSDQMAIGWNVNQNCDVILDNCTALYYMNDRSDSLYNCIAVRYTNPCYNKLYVSNSVFTVPNIGTNYILNIVDQNMRNRPNLYNVINLENNKYTYQFIYDVCNDAILNNKKAMILCNSAVQTTPTYTYEIGVLKVNTTGYYEITVTSQAEFSVLLRFLLDSTSPTVLFKNTIFNKNSSAEHYTLTFYNPFTFEGQQYIHVGISVDDSRNIILQNEITGYSGNALACIYDNLENYINPNITQSTGTIPFKE